MEYGNILFYDGDCALCNRSVQFVIKHEKPDSKLLFSALQSDFAKKKLSKFNYDFTLPASMVLIMEDEVYFKSTAALNLSKFLSAPYSWLIILKIIPKFSRDWVYDIIARNRKKWFKEQLCFVPDEKLRKRFIG